jgi:hypothetical protein
MLPHASPSAANLAHTSLPPACWHVPPAQTVAMPIIESHTSPGFTTVILVQIPLGAPPMPVPEIAHVRFCAVSHSEEPVHASPGPCWTGVAQVPVPSGFCPQVVAPLHSLLDLHEPPAPRRPAQIELELQ